MKILQIAARMSEGLSFESVDSLRKPQKGGGTTVQKSEPPAWMTPYLQYMGSTAQGLAQQPLSYYPGSTVSPFSDYTLQGFDQMYDLSQSPNSYITEGAEGIRGANDYLSGVGDHFAGLNDQLGALGARGQNLWKWQNRRLGNMYRGRTAEGNYWKQAARGDYLNGSPYLDSMYDTASHRALNDINSQFAAAGRYGSGAQGDAAARALAQEMESIYGRNYANERALQAQAAGNLGNMRSNAAQMMGANNQGYMSSQAALNQLGAGIGSQMANIGQLMGNNAKSLAALDPMDYQLSLSKAGLLGNIGAMDEAKLGEYLAEDKARFDYEQMDPWSRLQMMSGIINGTGALAGGNQYSTQPGGSMLAGGLGGGLLGMGLQSSMSSMPLFSGFSPLGFMGGPFGPAIGFGLGALGGMFG